MSAKFLPLAVHQIEARPLSWFGFINDWTIYFPNNRLTSDERMGDISRTVVLLFPKSATASNSTKGVANLQGTSFVGTSPNTPFHLLLQFGKRHAGFVPAVFGYDPLIGLGGIVDDFPNHPKLVRATGAYYPIFPCRHGSTNYSTGTPNALDADWMALFFSVCSSSARFRASSLASRTAFSAAFKRSLTFLASSGVNAG